MKTVLGALTVGATAALRVPWWLRGRRVEKLLDRSGGECAREISPGRTDSPATSPGTTDPAATTSPGVLPPPVPLATRAARAAINRLAKVPFSPWRNTCLYRSIAECLVMRHYGIPALIRIGVRNEAPPHGPIVAHAWVVYPGYVEVEHHIPLAPAAGLPTRDFGTAKVASPRTERGRT